MENLLSNTFNPSDFEVVQYHSFQEKQKLVETRKNKEKDLFDEVVNGLICDLETLGFEITYASKILINMVAQNVVLMQRFKLETAYEQLIVPNSKLVFDKNVVTKCDYYGKARNERYYENVLIGQKVNPAFEKYLMKLQKEISNGLKSLGLHPTQLIERQKLTIVRKLRQKYEDLTSEITIEASKEKNIFGKNNKQELTIRK